MTIALTEVEILLNRNAKVHYDTSLIENYILKYVLDDNLISFKYFSFFIILHSSTVAHIFSITLFDPVALPIMTLRYYLLCY